MYGETLNNVGANRNDDANASAVEFQVQEASFSGLGERFRAEHQVPLMAAEVSSWLVLWPLKRGCRAGIWGAWLRATI